MLSIFLVAGNNTNGLKRFLSEKGALEVLYSYNTLQSAISFLENNIIAVDMLMYVYKAGDIDIRKEFQALRVLLKSDKFFKVDKILLILEKPELQDKVLDYFKTVMEDSDFSKYEIEQTNSSVTYQDCYAALTGITTSTTVLNKYVKVFRTERGTDDRFVHDYGGNKDIIEPFDIENLRLSTEVKKAMIRAETGIPIREVPLKKKIPDDLYFPHIKVNDDFSTEVFSWCGDSTLGVTSYMLYIACSCLAFDNKILIVNMSNNSHMANIATENHVSITRYDKSILVMREFIPVENQLGFIDLSSVDKQLADKLVCEYIFGVPKKLRNYDYLFIDSPSERVLSLLDGVDNSIIYVMDDKIKSIDSASVFTQKRIPAFIWMSAVEKQAWDFERVSIPDIKKKFEGVRLIRSRYIENFFPDSKVFSDFLESCGKELRN
jgi:hypothetical protein